MRVKDLMTRDPNFCGPQSSVRLVAQMLVDHECAAIPVCEDGKLVGVITDRDLAVRTLAGGKEPLQMTAQDCMTSPVVTIGPNATFEEAAALMVQNRIHHLPVTDADGTLIGMVAQSDLGRRMSNREFGQLARETSIPPWRSSQLNRSLAKSH
jgi:CBS domain-containing protein